ncbi:lipopolysaccharide biosynthesis protein [Marinobacter zhanjiangensis]|uniref:lipopolysaccharide biosynthesis protein n=1 Tax=Marinobacter zhanjiangensis TaxID=578215 RepID=UPI00167413E9|nr:lipopolysaccharide biosynthesis protein [Marinobacter zhanjiangensis]
MSTNTDHTFSNQHLEGNLKNHSVRSVGFTVSAQGLKLLFQVISITVLARLLQPEDFGLVAMVTVFTGLALAFMEGGLSMATIQRPHITHEQVSNLFWTNVGLGFLLGLIYIAASPLVALIYGEDRIIEIMCALSLFFLIGGLSVQHEAILKRQMNFKALAVIEVVANLVGVCVAISMAWYGFGYWSLVGQQIATITVMSIMRWLAARWTPGWISRGSGVRSLLGFGMNLTGANFVGYFATNITPFGIGLVGGAQPLGLYDRAFKLTSIPSKQLLPPVFNVFQSALARVAEDEHRLRSAIISLAGKIALTTVFVTLVMVVTADWLVAILLGDGWDDAVILFQLLATFSVVEPITTFIAISLVSIGESKALLKWKIITFFILLVFVAVGSVWGVMGIVIAYAISGFFIRMPLFLLYSTRFLPITIFDHLRALVPSLLIGLITGLLLYALRLVYEPQNPVYALLVFSTLGAALYLFFSLSIRRTRLDIVELLGYVRTSLGYPRA